MQRRGLRRAAGQDERLQRLELLFAVVDRLLELGDARVGEARLLELLAVLLGVRRGEQGADGEQVALDRREDLVDARHHLDGARRADHGVELVDVAVRLDARVVLLDAAAAEESGAPVVAGLGVDLVCHARKLTPIGNAGHPAREGLVPPAG